MEATAEAFGQGSGQSSGNVGVPAATPTAGVKVPVRASLKRRPPKVPFFQRFNARMIIFGVVMMLPIGYIVYDFVDSVITGGIKDMGNGYKLVDLKAMSNFPLDQVAATQNDVPQKWRDLDGKKVVLYGEMWDPMGAGDGVAGFQLCYSITKCCFNGPPQVQHFVKAQASHGKSLNYYPNLVKVTGTLHVHVVQEAGRVGSVYQMDVDSIDPST